MISGRCECGAVALEVDQVRPGVTVCHCSQCRRMSGHLWASTHAPFDALRVLRDDGLRWYASSEFARRGFCNTCGASLFYRMNDEDWIGIAAGCLDETPGLGISDHIFVSCKGTYYEIACGRPVSAEG